jgi:hypothetical protein
MPFEGYGQGGGGYFPGMGQENAYDSLMTLMNAVEDAQGDDRPLSSQKGGLFGFEYFHALPSGGAAITGDIRLWPIRSR